MRLIYFFGNQPFFKIGFGSFLFFLLLGFHNIGKSTYISHSIIISPFPFPISKNQPKFPIPNSQPPIPIPTKKNPNPIKYKKYSKYIMQSNPTPSTLPEPDHISPSTAYSRLRHKYSKMQDKLLQTYLNMHSTNKDDYFPTSQINPDTIAILNTVPMFSARVILAKHVFNVNVSGTPFQVLFLAGNQGNGGKGGNGGNGGNQTYREFLRLRQEYQQRYISDIGYLYRKEVEVRIKFQCSTKNYEFYTNPNGIDRMHEKQGDYQFLQSRHDYIQWMFPNHYQSVFNCQSYPMSYLQVVIFRKSKSVGEKLVKSLHIFLDFLGVRVHPDYTFEIISKYRLKQALLINCHNHLRLRRLLACLSITGFRNLALKFIAFLEWVAANLHPFARIGGVCSKEWSLYGDRNLSKALELCFHTQDQFPQPHSVVIENFHSFGPGVKVVISNTANMQKNIDTRKYKIKKFDDSSSEEEIKIVKSQPKKQENKEQDNISINKNEKNKISNNIRQVQQRQSQFQLKQSQFIKIPQNSKTTDIQPQKMQQQNTQNLKSQGLVNTNQIIENANNGEVAHTVGDGVVCSERLDSDIKGQPDHGNVDFDADSIIDEEVSDQIPVQVTEISKIGAEQSNQMVEQLEEMPKPKVTQLIGEIIQNNQQSQNRIKQVQASTLTKKSSPGCCQL